MEYIDATTDLTLEEIGTVIENGEVVEGAGEVDKYRTNATRVDTDEDGLSDGDEFVVGTDPLDPDSDDDGILDGNETFTTTATDGETGVTVSVSGEGNLAKDVTIHQTPEYHNGTATSAGPTVAVDGLADGSETTVTIPVNEPVDAPNLSIFDLSFLAGQTVTFRFETNGSRAEIESLDVRRDSDGDGLWDHVEAQTWSHPVTGRNHCPGGRVVEMHSLTDYVE